MNNKKEPKFKVGDWVYIDGLKTGYLITSIMWHTDGYFVYYTDYGHNCYSENRLELVHKPGTITESQTLCGTEQKFEVGKQYEFSDGEDWVKGKAVGTVDYEGQRNFVAEINGKLSVFESIRSIQPVKISRWINICPDGRVLRKSYETRDEAAIKAEQGGMADCKQIKLEGVIL